MLITASGILAQTTDPQEEAMLRHWTKTLGSDEFGGRKPMSEYEPKTIEYIAGEMKALGLKPAFDGSYFQKMDMISVRTRPEGEKMTVKGKKKVDLKFPDDYIIWTARAADKITIPAAEYVFCGFGIDAPEYGWNDFDGVDVKGKIIIAMVNDPGYYDSSLFRGRNMTYYGRWIYKFEQAQRLGAAGCLVLHNTEAASYGWHVCVNGHLQGNLALFDKTTKNADALAMKGWLHEDGCRKIFQAAGMDMDAAIASAKKPGFKAMPLRVKSDIKLNLSYEISQTSNVAGVLPGTDLKDEVVVFNGHWDHFGYGKPDETGDEIYNGAADNASGVANVLMLAKKYSDLAVRPRRSLLFMAVTSEESGLFGSQYYCEHPAFPMEKTATIINFDCVAPAPLTHDVTVLGGGECTLDEQIVMSAAAQGRHVVFDNDNSDGWFFRSDHYNFVKMGVPALVIGNGKELVDPSRPNKYPQDDWYHKPSDEYKEDWDYSGTIANLNMMYSVGLSVANADKMPEWLRTSASHRKYSSADPVIANTIAQVSKDSITSYINHLVAFHTRHSMSSMTDPQKGLGAAVNYLRNLTESWASKAQNRPKPIVEVVNYQTGGKENRMDRYITVPNLMVTLPGTEGTSEIVLLAHMDTRVNDLSDSTTFAPGANDDGSGVSCLLEMTRLLSQVPLKQTVRCIFVSCEEQSLNGSKYMAAKAKEEGWPIIAVINNDMIGNSEASGTHFVERNAVRVFSESKSGEDSENRQIARYIKETAGIYVPGHEIKLMYRPDRYRRGGDQSSFISQGFPAVRMTEYYENYDRTHQIVRNENGIAYGDVISGVDIEYLTKNIQTNISSVMNLASAPAKPAKARIANANELSASTILSWEPVLNAQGAPDESVTYEILCRETDQPVWNVIGTCGPATSAGLMSAEFDLSKDNFFFAVRSVSADGNPSLPAVCK